MSRITFDRIALWTARLGVGLLPAVPGALLLVSTFTDDGSSQSWGPRLFFAFLFGLGLALLLTPPERWFKTPRWPGSRRR